VTDGGIVQAHFDADVMDGPAPYEGLSERYWLVLGKSSR
jgi:hypothetical protein